MSHLQNYQKNFFYTAVLDVVVFVLTLICTLIPAFGGIKVYEIHAGIFYDKQLVGRGKGQSTWINQIHHRPKIEQFIEFDIPHSLPLTCQLPESSLRGLPILLYSLGGKVTMSALHESFLYKTTSRISIYFTTISGENCEVSHYSTFDHEILTSTLKINNQRLARRFDFPQPMSLRYTHMPLTFLFSDAVSNLFWIPEASLFNVHGVDMHYRSIAENPRHPEVFWCMPLQGRGTSLSMSNDQGDPRVAWKYWLTGEDGLVGLNVILLNESEPEQAELSEKADEFLVETDNSFSTEYVQIQGNRRVRTESENTLTPGEQGISQSGGSTPILQSLLFSGGKVITKTLICHYLSSNSYKQKLSFNFRLCTEVMGLLF